MAQGEYEIHLPEVNLDEKLRAFFDEDSWQYMGLEDDPIESVEYAGMEEVQCIEVDDPEHIYLTDDFIPTHNTANIVFLKSNDVDMIKTLEEQSGKTHVSYIDSKQIRHQTQRVANRNESEVTYTMSTVEEPVISANDMLFLPQRNSLVFRAGGAPIWNRNETILPMSWMLNKEDIKHPGHSYSFQTIPTLSSAKDFDVRKNIPDFEAMLEKRIAQATASKQAEKIYKDTFGYSDFDISQLDPDKWANDVMRVCNQIVLREQGGDSTYEAKQLKMSQRAHEAGLYDRKDEETQKIIDGYKQDNEKAKECIYAGGRVSPSMLYNFNSKQPMHSLDVQIMEAFEACKHDFERDSVNFKFIDDNMYDSQGKIAYIYRADNSADLQRLQNAIKNPDERVFANALGDEDPLLDFNTMHGSYNITTDFLRFLATRSKWDFAFGNFELAMRKSLEKHD